jgi:hypothetical protein
MSDCYLPFEIGDFTRLSMNSVKFSAEDVEARKCKQMQSFGYVADWDGISSDDLGASIEQIKNEEDVYIRSRKDMFPLLLITPERIEFNNVLHRWHDEADIFEVSFIDEVRKDCDNCGYCGERDDKSVRSDIRDLASSWMGYIREISFATYTEDAVQVSGWYNETWLKAKELAGTITLLSIDYNRSMNARTELRLANVNVQPQNINFGVGYIGLLMKFKIPKSILSSGGFDFELADKNQAFK